MYWYISLYIEEEEIDRQYSSSLVELEVQNLMSTIKSITSQNIDKRGLVIIFAVCIILDGCNGCNDATKRSNICYTKKEVLET